MTKFIARHLFGNEIRIGFDNLSGTELLWFFVKFGIMSVIATTIFVFGANSWLTLFNVDFHFVWWSGFLFVIAFGFLTRVAGLTLSLVIGTTGFIVSLFM